MKEFLKEIAMYYSQDLSSYDTEQYLSHKENVCINLLSVKLAKVFFIFLLNPSSFTSGIK
jgi:hypothetical protein